MSQIYPVNLLGQRRAEDIVSLPTCVFPAEPINFRSTRTVVHCLGLPFEATARAMGDASNTHFVGQEGTSASYHQRLYDQALIDFLN